jgi:hypothetical protein
MVGFDEIDRQHRPRPPIRLECERCAASGDDVFRRFSLRDGDAETQMLCYRCWLRWR